MNNEIVKMNRLNSATNFAVMQQTMASRFRGRDVGRGPELGRKMLADVPLKMYYGPPMPIPAPTAPIASMVLLSRKTNYIRLSVFAGCKAVRLAMGPLHGVCC